MWPCVSIKRKEIETALRSRPKCPTCLSLEIQRTARSKGFLWDKIKAEKEECNQINTHSIKGPLIFFSRQLLSHFSFHLIFLLLECPLICPSLYSSLILSLFYSFSQMKTKFYLFSNPKQVKVTHTMLHKQWIKCQCDFFGKKEKKKKNEKHI